MGDLGRGCWFHVYQSQKYARLQVWVFGNRQGEQVRQFRIEGAETLYSSMGASLNDAVKLCRARK